MDSLASQDGQMLRARLEQARESLRGLLRELRATDAELEGLASERQLHRLLHDACVAVEGLDAMGAAAHFWGERAPAGEGAHRIREARGRVDAFQKRVSEIEERREAREAVRERYRSLDERLARIEKYVTSSRYDLDREFRNL